MCILWGTVLTAQINDSEKTIVANIRRQYAQAHEVIKQQQDDVQMHNNAVLMFNHNVPGIGPRRQSFVLVCRPHVR